MKGERLLAVPRRIAVGFALLGNVVPAGIAVATKFSSHHPIFFIGAVGLPVAAVLATCVRRRHPIPFYIAAFGGLPAATLLQAYTGGVASGYSVLTMMAMIWFGLQASDRELIVAALVLAACSYLPMVIVGPPAYPVNWGQATLLVVVGLAVAGSLRTLARETARLTDRLRNDAVLDELTGLLNRRGWRDAASREIRRARRSGTPLTLLTLDLDHLKQLNDRRGHADGDRMLHDTAERMRRALRDADILGRIGGDEFVALLTDSTQSGTLTALRRLREATPPDEAFSAGIAHLRAGEELEGLLHRADLALYAAKSAGGGRTMIMTHSAIPVAAPAQSSRERTHRSIKNRAIETGGGNLRSGLRS